MKRTFTTVLGALAVCAALAPAASAQGDRDANGARAVSNNANEYLQHRAYRDDQGDDYGDFQRNRRGSDARRDRRDGWVQLGAHEASRRWRTDNFGVPGRERFGEILVCARRGGVDIDDAGVLFGNGRVQHASLNSRLARNDCRRIDLNGRARNVERVTLHYRAAGGRDPIVEVYGR